jgi:hypothetical protein
MNITATQTERTPSAFAASGADSVQAIEVLLLVSLPLPLILWQVYLLLLLLLLLLWLLLLVVVVVVSLLLLVVVVLLANPVLVSSCCTCCSSVES